MRSQKIILIVLCIAGWFALAAQFYLIILNRTTPIGETVVRYFSFFTILTNLMVVVCCTFLALKPASPAGIFFSRSETLTGIAVYIAVVAVVYNTILRFLWKPEGLQLVVDELLHSIIPVLFIIVWFLSIRKKFLKWKNIYAWLIYPLVYIIYILIRGAFSGFYPYPFINVTEHGYEKVLVNCLGLLLVFLFFSFLFVAIGKLRSKMKKNLSKRTNVSAAPGRI